MSESIHHIFFFPHPPEKVWDYLTKAQLMEQWLMKSDFQPVLGCEFQFNTKPMPQYDFDGIIHCKVLEIMPCEILSYSWKSGSINGKNLLDSVVRWTLTPKEGGTELKLEHSGFKEQNVMMYTVMSDGWLKNIQKISNYLINATHGHPNA